MISRRRPTGAVAVGASMAMVVALAACGGGDPDVVVAPTEVIDEPAGASPSEPPAADTALSADEAQVAGGPWVVTTRDLAAAAGLPRMLVSDGDVVRRLERGVAVRVADPDERIGTVLGDGTGTIFYETMVIGEDGVAEAVGIVRRLPDGSTSAIGVGPHRSVRLHDLVRVGSTTSVLYATFGDPEGIRGEVTGSLVLHDPISDAQTRIADAAASRLLLGRAAASADHYVLTYASDHTEVVEYRDLDGQRIRRPSPTDGSASGRAPFVSSAVPSEDGSEVAYLEGVDPGVTDEIDDLALGSDDWQVVVMDADGSEQLRLTVADRRLAYVTIDFDGRWLLVSGGDAEGPVEPLLVDTEAPDLAAFLLAGVRGEARLESAAGPLVATDP